MACRKSVLPFCFTASGALQPLSVAHSGSDVGKVSEDSGLKALWGTSERERDHQPPLVSSESKSPMQKGHGPTKPTTGSPPSSPRELEVREAHSFIHENDDCTTRGK